MIKSWKDLKKDFTSKGTFSFSLISESWDVSRIVDHEQNIGLRVGCYSLSREHRIFKKKLPKLSQIQISWSFGKTTALVILLQDKSFEEQFVKFIEIISEKVYEINEPPLQPPSLDDEEFLLRTIINECFKWSLFLMTDKERKLKLHNQKGLIAELIFLKELFKKLELSAALNSWTGPDKLTKDFILNNFGFEIKSIQTGNRNKVTISSYDQLNLIGLNKLFLVTYLLGSGTKDNELSFSLTDLVNEIREALSFDHDSKFYFEQKLTLAGFSDLDDYSDCIFIKSKNPSFYSVTNDFPSITTDNIDTKSILRVNYDLDISTLERFKVDEHTVMNNIKNSENKFDLKEDPLKEKIYKGETKFIEFKQSLSLDIKKIDKGNYSPKKENYLEDVCIKNIAGFMNAEGGELFIGIKDDPIEIFGIEKELEILYKSSTDKILLHIKNLIKSNLGLQFIHLIDIEIIEIEDKKIIRISCNKSSDPVLIKDIHFYLRCGPSTEKLEGKELLEYTNKRFK
tara:strand:- start:3466 stop:5001 length:1536 start_codon:yes stop_codon:yes gene_type:complete